MRNEAVVNRLEVPRWLAEDVGPGEVYLLMRDHTHGNLRDDPFCAVIGCLNCGTVSYVTRMQLNGIIPFVCEDEECSTQFQINTAYNYDIADFPNNLFFEFSLASPS